jgi:hypothetical protein
MLDFAVGSYDSLVMLRLSCVLCQLGRSLDLPRGCRLEGNRVLGYDVDFELKSCIVTPNVVGIPGPPIFSAIPPKSVLVTDGRGRAERRWLHGKQDNFRGRRLIRCSVFEQYDPGRDLPE